MKFIARWLMFTVGVVFAVSSIYFFVVAWNTTTLFYEAMRDIFALLSILGLGLFWCVIAYRWL